MTTEVATDLPTLKEARQAAGMTQQQMADRANLSIATVRDLEQHVRTHVRSRTLRTLCALLMVEGFSDITLRTT